MTDQTEVMQIPQSVSMTVNITDDIRKNIMNVGAAMRLANSYTIDSNDMAQMAQGEIRDLSVQVTKIETMRDDLMVEPKKTLDKIKGWFNPAIEDKSNAITILKGKIAGWLTAERNRVALENKQREEAERRARQEAEQKAAAERARAEEQAREQERKCQEALAAQRKAEAEGNARAAAAAAAAAAKAAEQAKAALENGNAKAMEALLAAATQAAPVVAEVAKVKGFSQASKWIAEFVQGVDEDKAKALIAAECAARPELLALLSLDMSAANKLAAAQKSAMRVPGMVARETFVNRAAKR